MALFTEIVRIGSKWRKELLETVMSDDDDDNSYSDNKWLIGSRQKNWRENCLIINNNSAVHCPIMLKFVIGYETYWVRSYSFRRVLNCTNGAFLSDYYTKTPAYPYTWTSFVLSVSVVFILCSCECYLAARWSEINVLCNLNSSVLISQSSFVTKSKFNVTCRM